MATNMPGGRGRETRRDTKLNALSNIFKCRKIKGSQAAADGQAGGRDGRCVRAVFQIHILCLLHSESIILSVFIYFLLLLLVCMSTRIIRVK